MFANFSLKMTEMSNQIIKIAAQFLLMVYLIIQLRRKCTCFKCASFLLVVIYIDP